MRIDFDWSASCGHYLFPKCCSIGFRPVYQCSAFFPPSIGTASEVGDLFSFVTMSVWNVPDWWLAGWLAESQRNPSLAMMSFAMSMGCKVLKRGLLTLVTSRSLSQQRRWRDKMWSVCQPACFQGRGYLIHSTHRCSTLCVTTYPVINVSWWQSNVLLRTFDLYILRRTFSNSKRLIRWIIYGCCFVS